MTFIIFFFFFKKFEKVEKTGIISTKFWLRCTPSVILGGKPNVRDTIFKIFLDFEVKNLKRERTSQFPLRPLLVLRLVQQGHYVLRGHPLDRPYFFSKLDKVKV